MSEKVDSAELLCMAQIVSVLLAIKEVLELSALVELPEEGSSQDE